MISNLSELITILPIDSIESDAVIITNISDVFTNYTKKSKCFYRETDILSSINIDNFISSYKVTKTTHIYLILFNKTLINFSEELSRFMRRSPLWNQICTIYITNGKSTSDAMLKLLSDTLRDTVMTKMSVWYQGKKNLFNSICINPGQTEITQKDSVDIIDCLLWKPVDLTNGFSWNSSSLNAEGKIEYKSYTGIQYITNGLIRPEETNVMHKWSDHFNKLLKYIQNQDGMNENSLHIYEEILKRMVWSVEYTPLRFNEKGDITPMSYLKNKLYDACVYYFDQLFRSIPDTDYHKILIYLMRKRKETNKTFVFTNQFVFNRNFHKEFISQFYESKHVNNSLISKFFSVAESDQFSEFNNYDYMIKTNVLGRALTTVIDAHIMISGSLLSIDQLPTLVNNEFIQDQLQRLASKLKYLLPSPLTHQHLLRVINTVFECDFSKTVPFFPYESIEALQIPISDWFPFIKDKMDKNIVAQIMYQYAYHAYLVVKQDLPKDSDIKVVTQQMESFRRLLETVPTDHSEIIPGGLPVLDKLIEAIIEFHILFLDLDCIKKESPSQFETLLVWFMFGENPSMIQSIVPESASWMDLEFMIQLYKINYIELKPAEYEKQYDLIMKLVKIYKSEPKYHINMHRFIHQFSNRGNLLPTRTPVRQITVADANTRNIQLFTEQKELRTNMTSQSRTELKKYDTELKKLAELVQSNPDTSIYLNRMNILVRYVQKSVRTIEPIVVDPKIVVTLLSKDTEYKDIYKMYMNRDELMLTPEQVRQLSIVLLNKIKEKASIPQLSDKIKLLLVYMNEYNVDALTCLYSYMYKRKSMPGFEDMVLCSLEEAQLITRIIEHYNWAEQMDINDFGTDDLSWMGITKDKIPTIRVHEACYALSGINTVDFIREQVEHDILRMNKQAIHALSIPEWTSLFKSQPDVRQDVINVLFQYFNIKSIPLDSVEKDMFNTYVQSFMEMANELYADNTLPITLNTFINTLISDVLRLSWYQKKTQATSAAYLDDCKKVELTLSYLLSPSIITAIQKFMGDHTTKTLPEINQLKTVLDLFYDSFTRITRNSDFKNLFLNIKNIEVILNDYDSLFKSIRELDTLFKCSLCKGTDVLKNNIPVPQECKQIWLSCGHSFHDKCIESWNTSLYFTIKVAKNCPTCMENKPIVIYITQQENALISQVKSK
jgi:hypothetical protein